MKYVLQYKQKPPPHFSLKTFINIVPTLQMSHIMTLLWEFNSNQPLTQTQT